MKFPRSGDAEKGDTRGKSFMKQAVHLTPGVTCLPLAHLFSFHPNSPSPDRLSARTLSMSNVYALRQYGDDPLKHHFIDHEGRAAFTVSVHLVLYGHVADDSLDLV